MKKMKQISLIIMGYGGVGRSLVKIIHNDREYFEKTYGITFNIKAICEMKGCLINSAGLDLHELIHIQDYTQFPDWIQGKQGLGVIKEIKADILVESTWTNPKTGEPGFSHIKTALEHGMHIASSNKGPFYLKYKELKEIAEKNNLIIGIESTVGSAIPCLAAKRTIAGTHIKRIRAILNGTSNYILSRMTTENLNFELALKEAQELGYAEADPTLDIEGYDAAGKLVILANELLNWDKTIDDVEVAGITKVTAQAIELARKDHFYIKHVAVAEEGRLSVGLQLVPFNSPLAVNGTLNVVEISTEHGGPILFIGRGAGGPEAAAGILSDIINIAQLKNCN
jgi:homoserine dehydrogenase